jgi:hypothetical protein
VGGGHKCALVPGVRDLGRGDPSDLAVRLSALRGGRRGHESDPPLRTHDTPS